MVAEFPVLVWDGFDTSLCNSIQNGINKTDIYVIKIRFDITALPKVNEPREIPPTGPQH